MRFRTIMTGELFALLKQHSVLAGLLAGRAEIGEAFRQGVDKGFSDGEMGAELFSVRAGVLLGLMQQIDAASYISGLLIGCDLRSGLRGASNTDDVVVLGRGTLTSLYAAAIEQCGYRAREMDGAAAFVAGMRVIAETIT